jgi:hypothetical protein
MTAPTVEGYVLCEGHHVAPTGHCYFHGGKFCGDPDCGPCPGPFQDLIARPSVEPLVSDAEVEAAHSVITFVSREDLRIVLEAGAKVRKEANDE